MGRRFERKHLMCQREEVRGDGSVVRIYTWWIEVFEEVGRDIFFIGDYTVEEVVRIS